MFQLRPGCCGLLALVVYWLHSCGYLPASGTWPRSSPFNGIALLPRSLPCKFFLSLKHDAFNTFQSLFSLVILTIEATPLTQWGPCQPYTEKIAEKTVSFKYWQRAIFYGVSGCLVYFFCTASAIVNVAVFLLTMLVAFIYGFIVFKHKRMVSVLSSERIIFKPIF